MTCDKDVDIDELAQKTEGCSGAEAVALCQEAALFAMEEDVHIDSVNVICCFISLFIYCMCVCVTDQATTFSKSTGVIQTTHHTRNAPVLCRFPNPFRSFTRLIHTYQYTRYLCYTLECDSWKFQSGLFHTTHTYIDFLL